MITILLRLTSSIRNYLPCAPLYRINQSQIQLQPSYPNQYMNRRKDGFLASYSNCQNETDILSHMIRVNVMGSHFAPLLNDAVQAAVPNAFHPRLIHLSDYFNLAWKCSERSMYEVVREELYWMPETNSGDTTVGDFRNCAVSHDIFKRKRHFTLLPTNGLWECIAIDMLGLLPKLSIGNLLIIVIPGRSTN